MQTAAAVCYSVSKGLLLLLLIIIIIIVITVFAER